MERRKTSATTINASTTSRSNHDIEDVKVHHKHHHRGSSSSKNISRGLRVVVSSLERRLCLSAIRATKNCHSTLWCSTLWACFILVVYSCVNILPPEESMTDNHRILYQDLPGDLDDPTMPSSSSSSFIRSGASPRPSHHPRMIGYYFESIHSESFIGSERLDPNTIRLYKYGSISQKATTDITPDAILRQEHLQDSHDYNMGHADVFESDDCIAQYEWQKSSQPSCNLLLELDMQIFPSDSGGLLIKSNLNDDKSAAVKLIANGYWRDVWEVTSTVAEGEGHQKQHQQKVVLKTIRYEHDYDERNYDRHRRDAVAMERLTKSKYVMDIYGFCGNSGLFEYADGGSIEDWLWHSDNDSDRVEWTSQERLVVAHQLVSGLVATHNSDKPNVPAIAHVDITPSQFVFVKELGIFKLNDFNRCRFIRINKNDDKLCPYHVGSNPGTFRSPEEYAYEPQTEKVDIYSLGNILYSILTGLYPFEHQNVKESQKKVIAGETPVISQEFLDSPDPFDQAMLKAVYKCWVGDPAARATAREVQQFIGDELKRLGVQSAAHSEKD